MPDRLTPERRSWNMSRIRSRDTAPELRVRSLLHRLGYRFTVRGPHNRLLPGRPDIVLPRHRAVVFVHGCFWHRHPGCRQASTPKARADYWQQKFAGNIARDHRNTAALRELGWNVITVWECETRDEPALAAMLDCAIRRVTTYPLPEEPVELPRAAEEPGIYRCSVASADR